MPQDDRAIAIGATFTAEAIHPGLAFWAGELGLEYDLRFAGYNQIFQELLNPAGLFAGNRGGVNVALIRLEDWRVAGVESEARRFVEAVRSSAARFASPLIVVLCPSSTPEAERIVAEGVADLPSVHLITASEVCHLYPVAEVFDPKADELGHLPYTPEYFVALATAVARKIHAINGAPYKVIALDCDDTLWRGVCGEDGPHGVVIDEPSRALQEFMRGRRAQGLLLALCSKNNEEDVVETFRAHPEMPLRLDDFAARRLNWESKAENLASLAEELGVGQDSLVLVDDSAKECNEAQAGAPGVLALPLPAPEDIPDFLAHVWAFDRARVTGEDLRRADSYIARAQRQQAERSAANLEEFLAGLQLEVTIAPIQPSQIARVAQLTRRTNQMNTTLVRRSEAEIQTLDAEILTVDVTDRFGSYGLTGAAIFRCREDALVVDSLLLSCRVLGRGVEHRIVARLGEIALERGLGRVEIPFVPGPRNRPAALFLESIGAADGLSAAGAAAVRFSARTAPPPFAEVPEEDPVPQVVRSINYLRIATELRTPAAILERIRATSRKPGRGAADPPRSPLERELCELWAGLLNVEAVGAHDNFFELGGHSLLAVQLLSRVRQIHGVELSLEVVYSGDFTVAELARAIELKEIERSGADYQDLLRELEALSDEEARALLAEEQDAL